VRRLLFHSYHFPPIGGSGAQRPLKMARHLPSFGYEPVVVTRGGPERDGRWTPEDATLADEIPSSLEVWRVPAAEEPTPKARWRPLAERWLRVRHQWTAWWIDASHRVGLEAGADADLIYVWMQPYASADAGVALARDLDLPWVADLGDPWALDEMIVYPSALHRRLELRHMAATLSTASAIVMSTPEAARRLRHALPELAERPIVAIPNGFDASDFAGPPPPRECGRFRIVHTGYLHTELGEQHRRRRLLRRSLGGSARGLDILTRSHAFLVDALDLLLREDPQLGETIELHLAGVANEADERVSARCPVVERHGYLSHADSIALMRSADLLFLPLHKLPQGTRATIVPGKAYEYLASGTEILAALPDGDARDILTEAGNATLVEPDDVEGLAAAIRSALERSRAGASPRVADPSVVARFEYRRLAGELASVFDGILGPDQAAPHASSAGSPVAARG
jgi:glycosyltransferase involved in cell wall biosynthesis